MDFLKHFLLSLTLVLNIGCGSISYNQTSEKKFQSKQKNCTFKIYNAPPQVKYEEIGTVDLKTGFGVMGEQTQDAGEFKKKMHPYVCDSGGNGVIAQQTFGYYNKGIIIHTNE